MTADRYDLLSPEFHDDPAPVLARMRADAPVYFCPSLDAWVVTRHADVTRLVREPALSVDRGGTISHPADDVSEAAKEQLEWASAFVLRWMVFADPPKHTALREVARRAFTVSTVERLRPAIVRATWSALEPRLRTGRLDVLGDLAVPVPAAITAQLLGLPEADLDLLKRWTADTFALLGAGVASEETIRLAHGSLREARSYFIDVLAARRAFGGDDLLSAIVRSPSAKRLDEDDLAGLAMTLVAGAYETTTHLVGNGIWQLLQHPHALARLAREPEHAAHAVEELFRFDGPALSVVRRTTADLLVDDVRIPAGERVYCMLYAANRDPQRYPEPDRLDLDRVDVRHVGLGLGIHFCLGAALSRLEAEILLTALVALEDLALDEDALPTCRPRYVPNLAIRGLDTLPVRFRTGRAC